MTAVAEKLRQCSSSSVFDALDELGTRSLVQIQPPATKNRDGTRVSARVLFSCPNPKR